MTTVSVLIIGAIKVLLLLAAAGLGSLMLRRSPARLRAVLWGTALLGALLIPVVSVVIPPLPVTTSFLPSQPDSAAENTPVVPSRLNVEERESGVASAASVERAGGRVPGHRLQLPFDPASVALAVWAAGMMVLLLRQGVGLWRMHRIVRRASTITDPGWLRLAFATASRVGSPRTAILVASAEIDVPAVFGFLRPVVLLPSNADRWLAERQTAVLQHELIHVARFDWPVRVAARVAAAVYWFNPLVWWAVRRLDLEQEKACDEEVLSLGSKASSYACHLLGIAHAAVARPTLAGAGLEMARRSHLEERIMTILKRRDHRRVSLRLILAPAIVTAVLVPALAAVQPTGPGPRKASPELKAAIKDMQTTQDELAPYVDELENYEYELQPHIERIQAVDINIDDEAIARIEAEMQPILKRIEAVQLDMEPLHAQLEAAGEALEGVTLHIEDGTLEEIQHQIHEAMEAHHADLENLHDALEPYHEQLQALHAELEPLHEKMAELHRAAVPEQRELEKLHAEIEPIQRKMERVHERMEPVQRGLEQKTERLERALRGDLAIVLRSHLGAVTGPRAPFDEAAERLADEARIRLNDGVLTIDVSVADAREILADLFTPVRVGGERAFESALGDAAKEVSELRIEAD